MMTAAWMPTTVFFLPALPACLLRRERTHMHAPSPPCRATAIFTRVQVRLIGPVIVAVVLFTMLLEFIPVIVRRSCNGAVFGEMCRIL